MQSFKDAVCGKNIAVVGIGVSNIPLIESALKCGASVTAYDKKSESELGDVCEKLHGLGAELVLGEDYLSRIKPDTEILFKTPGLRYDRPELLAAAERGAEITSEMELFFKLCPCRIVAVTGSDGKTTTTTLIYEMLKKQGFTCHLGGNIGRPLIGDLPLIKSDDIAVLELSSFQLHTMKQSPDIAVVTNVTPNHLDWHTDMEEYIDAKRAVFKYQTDGGRAVFNADNDITARFAAECGSRAVLFGRRELLDDGVCLDGDMIVLRENGKTLCEILNINDIKIPGMHNVENYMAAIAALWGLVSVETIRYIAKNFGGVEHRIEFVREFDGVRYYNDSIASSPARTTAGLNSFEQKVVLIAGGYDKKIPFDGLGEIINDKVKKLILCGKTSDKIEKAVRGAKNYDGLPIYGFDDFKKAVEASRDISENGDVVLFSPACASFDMFKNFMERGNRFKEIVKNF